MRPNDFDFDRPFQKTSERIDKMHRLIPLFAILAAIMIVLLIIGLGLGVYWLWGVVVAAG